MEVAVLVARALFLVVGALSLLVDSLQVLAIRADTEAENG